MHMEIVRTMKKTFEIFKTDGQEVNIDGYCGTKVKSECLIEVLKDIPYNCANVGVLVGMYAYTCISMSFLSISTKTTTFPLQKVSDQH